MSGLTSALLLYGILNLALGVAGAIKGSMVSLYAGGGAGVIAIVAALVSRSNPKVGFLIGALVCVALLGRFAPKFFKDWQFYPGGIVAVASAAMLLALIIGHFAARKPA